jgi:hypothetical protein
MEYINRRITVQAGLGEMLAVKSLQQKRCGDIAQVIECRPKMYNVEFKPQYWQLNDQLHPLHAMDEAYIAPTIPSE